MSPGNPSLLGLEGQYGQFNTRKEAFFFPVEAHSQVLSGRQLPTSLRDKARATQPHLPQGPAGLWVLTAGEGAASPSSPLSGKIPSFLSSSPSLPPSLPSFLTVCCCLVSKSSPTLLQPMDCSPPGSSVHGIIPARILEWLPFPPPGDLPTQGIKPAAPT